MVLPTVSAPACGVRAAAHQSPLAVWIPRKLLLFVSFACTHRGQNLQQQHYLRGQQRGVEAGLCPGRLICISFPS